MNKNEFKAAYISKGKSIDDIAKCLCINSRTVYIKISTDGFTQKEIKKLIEYLEIEDPVKVFFT